MKREGKEQIKESVVANDAGDSDHLHLGYFTIFTTGKVEFITFSLISMRSL